MILSDNETKIDLLNYEAIAETIVKLLRSQGAQPVTLGVHGDWGAGKSSVLEMVEAALSKEEDVLCLKFNGWRFQGFEDAKIALIEGIVTGLINERPALTQAAEAVKDIFKRIDWLKMAKKAGSLAFTAYTGIPTPDLIQSIVGTLEAVVADPAALATKENIGSALTAAKSFLKPAESKSVPKEIAEFRKAFDDLLKKAGVKQLVVLIDDLDRCLPDTAIETLEAMRLFVFTARTAFIVAADEAMIEYAVRKHFPDLPDTTGPLTYARNYLEKLIQVPFRIPNLGDSETRIYVSLLLIGAELGEDSPEFGELINLARKKLQRPWLGEGFDAPGVRGALKDKASKAQNALTLSQQIAPILASGTKGNPRQIKRFLNALVLRQRMAEARGFGDDILLPVLAKLMLAERFLPRLFDQIASAAAAAGDGKSADLAGLEDNRPGEDRKQEKGERLRESGVLAEWLSSPAVEAWAKVPPHIAGIDLRPYLFVAKDRKDYFGAASVLGHLATVAEQLLGSKFAVQALEPDLKRVAPGEASQLFELVRGRIVGSDQFDKEPAGIAGLTVLVKAQPALEEDLLNFLEGLPPGRLGPWVCSGWQTVIKSQPMLARFDSLLERWSKEGGAMLKATAKAALRTGKKA